MRSYRWAWFVLACAATVALLLTLRFQYAACDTDGCVVVDRWTGDVRFRETEAGPAPEAEGTVVLRSGRPGAGAVASAWRVASRPEARSRPARSSRGARRR
jgi:hypothetical protein